MLMIQKLIKSLRQNEIFYDTVIKCLVRKLLKNLSESFSSNCLKSFIGFLTKSYIEKFFPLRVTDCDKAIALGL